MDQREILIGFSVLIVSIGAGFFLASTLTAQEEEKFDQFTNYTVNGEEGVNEVRFNNNSITLMYEDSAEARMYLDINNDGSFDRGLNTTNDGEERLLEQIVSKKNRSYRLYFRYRDNRTEQEDGYLTLYRIKEIL